LNLFTKFLGDSPVTLETAVRHTLHWLELGGAQHICLGGDLDGCDSLPVGFEGIRNYPDLADALLSRGVPEQIVRDMMYNNLIKVVKQCSI
jgi:membrane dipeptidase